MAIDLDEYRHEADRFLAALVDEQYRHFSGQKERLEIEAIYDRFADLSALSTCRELQDAGAPPLRRFACEGYLGHLVAGHEARLAELEATLEADVGGERIPYRMLRAEIGNEPDRERRRRLEEERTALLEHLLPVREEAHLAVAGAVPNLGAASYRALYEEFGFPLETMRDQCSRFLDQTEEIHVRLLDRLLRDRVGVELAQAERWDTPRLLRSDHWDEGFPAAGLLPGLEATLAELGIDLAAQRNVELDVEARPLKDPRPFCAPIEVPGRVVLCIKPAGGVDDWRMLYHEAGHTEHFAHTQAHLPFEARRLGDWAVTEGWAYLLEHLVSNPSWLSRRLDFGRPEAFAEESACVLLFFVRRYCAKLLYELELHEASDLSEMPARYAELLTEATKIPASPASYLDDVDPNFYVTSYLRAWAFEAQVRSSLAETFGSTWFASRKAGTLLRELWSEGQGLDADEILRELTGGTLDLAAVADGLPA